VSLKPFVFPKRVHRPAAATAPLCESVRKLYERGPASRTTKTGRRQSGRSPQSQYAAYGRAASWPREKELQARDARGKVFIAV
jgi:hypothetical protein